MDDETKNLVKEQYAKLPPALQQAIQSAGLHDQIAAIGTKNQLHIDQMGDLEEEVMMLMMGFTEPIEFPSHLQEQVHIDAAVAQKIATEVNQEILLPIRDRMEQAAFETTDSSIASDAPPVESKSVVMPSSAAAAPKPAAPPASVGQAPAPVSAPAAPLSTDMQINAPETPTAPVHAEADVMLTTPTVSMPPKAASAPAPAAVPTPAAAANVTPPAPAPIYKADPYREPIE